MDRDEGNKAFDSQGDDNFSFRSSLMEEIEKRKESLKLVKEEPRRSSGSIYFKK